MRIAALISATCQAELQRVLWTGHSLVVMESPDALVTLVSGGGCELIIIDPTGMRDEVFHDMLTAVSDSGVALAIWARKNAATFARILQASVFAPTMVVLRGVNDDVHGLQAMVRSGGSTTATAILLHRLAGQVLVLPQDSVVRRTAMFCGGPIPASVEAYTAGAGRTSRTVQRRFLEAGLGKPGRFLKIVRLARAWDLLQTLTTSLAEVAAICGFASEKALSAQFSLCVGAPPRRAIRRLTQEAFVEHLLSAITDSKLG